LCINAHVVEVRAVFVTVIVQTVNWFACNYYIDHYFISVILIMRLRIVLILIDDSEGISCTLP